jgi:electron transfer flavoprotein alpha subunit
MAPRVWIVPQLKEGALPQGARETIAAGQELAAALGGSAEIVLLGRDLEAAGQAAAGYAVAAVRRLEAPALGVYTPGAWVGALAQAASAERPDFLLFPHSYQTVDFAPRLAQEIGAALVPEAVSFHIEGGGLRLRRPILGGKLVAEVGVRGDGPVVVSLQAGAFGADRAQSGGAAVSELSIDAAALRSDREIVRTEAAAKDQVDLTQAAVIVAVGRGVGGADKLGAVEELAKLLGGELGASRPVIDSGWLPRDRQIGSSGQTVAPKLYLALGISGAIQHLVGMKGSQVVVAVNKDRNAPIFSVARYGVVADLHELLPHLIAALEETS